MGGLITLEDWPFHGGKSCLLVKFYKVLFWTKLKFLLVPTSQALVNISPLLTRLCLKTDMGVSSPGEHEATGGKLTEENLTLGQAS